MTTREEKKHGFERGVGLYREALEQDAVARTKEDFVGVEETYWMAFNVLIESQKSEHQEICASILERIARQLHGEGRPDSAESLLRRAGAIRKEVCGDLPGSRSHKAKTNP